jgi:hypothetical protein
MPKANPKEQSIPASRLIDERIHELGDWRGKMLSRLRALIRQADPDVVEEWKWSVPVWSHEGLICTGESYKKAVKPSCMVLGKPPCGSVKARNQMLLKNNMNHALAHSAPVASFRQHLNTCESMTSGGSLCSFPTRFSSASPASPFN